MTAARPRLIHEAVAAQAATRPDALAVVDGDERVSYADLVAAARAYAAELAAHGIGPGDIVPVVMQRSAAMTACLLAILGRGAAYAALDRRWPDDRVATVAGQLGARLVVAEEPEAKRVAAATGHTVPVWQPSDEALTTTARRAPATTDAPGVEPSTAASVFFTSGTTGVPKGVVSPHRATTRLFDPDGPMSFGPGHVMPQAAPVAWDAFSLELWGMLTTGGTSYVVRDDHLLPHALQAAINGSGVDTAWLTSSLFDLFVEIDVECFAGLRRLFIGGEKLSPRHVRAFLTRYPDTDLLNGYGPVESCVFATTHAITLADCDLPGGIPIGRPVPGTDVLVVDGGVVRAAGEEGELCIAGDGLAIGYVGDARLTAEKFVTIDVDGVPTRVYRTGDAAVRDRTGLLHFKGRTDRQVKIRGFRIELGEVESVAGRLPGIDRCAAVPVPGGSGGYERLALFFTSATDDGLLDARDLRRTLAERLPAHCVPDAVRRVERMPTTANGKLDAVALLRGLDG